MKYVRHSRKALRPIWHLLHPKPWTMTGNKAFNRNKGKRFQDLATHLDDDAFKSFCVVIGFIEINTGGTSIRKSCLTFAAFQSSQKN